MRREVAVLVLPLLLGVGACGEDPVAPTRMAIQATAPSFAAQTEGTGLVLESLTKTPLGLGDIVINQAVVKEFGIVEDVASGLLQLEARGIVELQGTALGLVPVTEEFSTSVGIVNRGGGCEIITVNPAPLELDLVGGAVVDAELPASTIDVRGGGAVGTLLCQVGKLLNPVTRGASRAVQSLVDAINNLIP